MTRILITGANGGLGMETCKHLINDRFVTHLVMACRTEPKATAARAQLLAETGGAEGITITTAAGFDMNDPDSIRAAVDGLPDQPFDVVFLQAGGVIYGKEWRATEVDGATVERTIFQNVIGAHITLAALLQRDLVKQGARVVIAGGEGARGLPGVIESPHFEGPEDLRSYVLLEDTSRPYVEMNAMGVSKFASALWSQDVAERFGHRLEMIWFTPGFTAGTGGLQGIGPVKQWLFENVGFPLFKLLGRAQNPSQGGRKFADCLEGKIGHNGDLIGAPEGKGIGALTDQKPMNPDLTNPALRAEFWSIVEEVAGPLPQRLAA